MERLLHQLNSVLTKMIGLHRQLLEVVRMEVSALSSADLKEIQEITFSKEALIAAIQLAEGERAKVVAAVSSLDGAEREPYSLNQIIVENQVKHPEHCRQLGAALNALRVLIQRISEQNDENRAFLEASLSHVQRMKGNLVGVTPNQTQTYTQQGQTASAPERSRLIEREA